VEEAWPGVSVVVPTRDRPEHVGRAIESILGQRYPGTIECVVVFDQSRPDRRSESRDSRILRVVTNERTPGAAGARNTGALAGTGTLLAFCDDDDRWHPDMVRLQVEEMRRRGAPASVCGSVLLYGRRRFVRLPPPEIRLSQLLRSPTLTNLSSLVVRRDFILERVGLMDEDVPGSSGGDYEFMIRLATAYPILGVPRPLVLKNWNRSSWFDQRWDRILPGLRYLLSKHPELRQDPRGLARIVGKMAFGLAASGQRSEAASWIRQTLALDWRQPRAYLAWLVAKGWVRAATIERLVHWLVGRRI
jgi:glycosyltransferase involved in cell wall biosynthesis